MMREMKDSGVEWIGEIPITWKCCKQKYEVTLLNGRAYKDNEFEEDGKYPILRVGNLFSNPVWYSSSLELPQDKYCNSGDLLYSWSMSYSPIIWEGPKVIYHYHIWKTILSDSVYKKFVYYYMKALTDALKAEIHETTMGFITMGVMNNSYFAFPTKSEQRSIANYLDQKCSEIDAITKDIQTQIDTLEQYKRSVITEAVTNGLDPDVEMKDSGIEWLKIIPSHWNIIPSKFLFHNSDVRKKYGDKQLTASQKHGIITQEDYMARENAKIVLANQDIEKWKHVEPNDFVISLRSFQGGLEMSETTGCITWHYVVLKASKKIFPRFYKWLFKSSQYINALQGTCNFIRDGQDLRYSNFSQVPLYEPPIKEQKEIADYLDSKVQEIDSIIQSKQQQLSTLSDYKKSLIYEYVTGKKEVPAE